VSYRWSKEDLEVFEKRAREMQGLSPRRVDVREHICSDAEPSKYGNQKTVVDGIKFASKKEAKRYETLKVLASTLAIYELRLQVRFSLAVNGLHICDYIADFSYKDSAGKQYVEDCKGYKTDVYKLKRQLMKACFGIEVRET
jgi:hypothetical protein